MWVLVIVLVLISVMCGIAGVVLSALAGSGLLGIILSYIGGGMIGSLAVLLFVALKYTLRARPSKLGFVLRG